MTATAIGLLVNRRAFRSYWSGRVLSMMGDGIALITLTLYVQSVVRTALAVTGLMLARALPRMLGPVGGGIADHHDPRRVMLVCDCAQAVIYTIIAVTLPSYAVLICLVAAATVFTTVFQPAGQASVPTMVEDDELLQANAWLGTAVNLQVAIGPLIGGLLVALAGTRVALGVNAASFVASALCIARLPSFGKTALEVGQSVLSSSVDGLLFVSENRAARSLTLLVFGCSLFLAVDTVALIFLIRTTLHGSSASYGFASSTFGIGMVAVSVGLLARVPRRSPAVLLVGALLVGAVGCVATGVASTVVLVILFQAITGAGNGLENIATDTLVQTRFDAAVIGRVWSVVSTVGWIATGLSAVGAGIMVDALGPRAVFIGAGIGTAIVTMLLARFVIHEPADEGL